MNHLYLILLFVLVACGQPTSNRHNKNGLFPMTFSNSPDFFKIQNQSCSAEQFEPTNTIFSLNLFLNNESTRLAKDFSPLFEGNFLQNNQVISKTIYDEEVLLVGEKAYQRAKPKRLRLCSNESDYASDTVESAALNVSYYIHKTHQRFISLFPEIPVSPVMLSLSPAIIISGTKSGTYWTDNAFYSPARKTITILPPSLERKFMGYDTKYWEVPMIASHEYGHHLFEMIHRTNKGPRHKPLSCFGNSMHAIQNGQDNIPRNASISDVMDSYNEGFADLVAYYTLDSKERGLKGVKCLQVTRDVGSDSFFYGAPKHFSENALQSFFSFSVDNSISSCDEHNYQDTHVLGAIFAHSADVFLSELTDSDDEKLMAVVEWVGLLKNVEKKYQAKPAQAFLEASFSLFIRNSLEKFERKFDKNICLVLNDLYPELTLKECSKKDL